MHLGISTTTPKGSAMTLEADNSHVSRTTVTDADATDPVLQEEELDNVVISAESYKYFSTPVHINSKERSLSDLNPQEDPLCYKSFFTKECDDIVHQLQGSETRGWSVGKRKLEELEISTIEAEPAPFYCTPKSVLDDTTCSAKRRRITNSDHTGNLELRSYSTQYNKSSGFRPFTLQCLEKSLQKLNRFRADEGVNLVPAEPNILLNSLTAPKRSLSQKMRRLRYSQPTFPGKTQCTGNGAQNDVYTPRSCNSSNMLTPVIENGSSGSEWKIGAYVPGMQHKIHYKKFTRAHRSPVPEYKSFFAAECEKIYNQLKMHDLKRMRLGDVSTIEAEPPPVLTNTINSIIIVELENTRTMEKSALSVSQLDLEKMNMDYSVPETALPLLAASDHVLCSSNGNEQIETVTIADITQDIVSMPGEGPVGDATQDIVTTHGEGSVTDATQDIELMHYKMSIVDSMLDNVTMDSEMPVAEAEAPIGTMCSKVSDLDATQDIVVNVEPVTYFTQKHVLPQGEVTVHKNMHEVITLPKSFQDIISIQTEPSVIAQSHLSFQEKVTICNAEKETCINMVTRTPLQDFTSVQHRGNLSKYPQGVRSIPTEVTTSLVINKTFTHCKKTISNYTQDVFLKHNNGTTTTTVLDTTTIFCDTAMPNITQDIVLINGEMTQANATQTIECMYSEVPPISYLTYTSDSTKVIAANKTLLSNLPENANNPTNEFENRCRQVGPANGNRFYANDSTPDLDITDLAHDGSDFCAQPRTLITSTPLPGISNHLFIKKACGGPIQQKQRPFLNHVQETKIRASIQQKETVLLPRQPLIGDTQIIERTYKGLRLPQSSRSSIPKAPEVSKTLQPACGIRAPCSTQALTPVLKTPGMVTAPTEAHMGLCRTSIRPEMLTSLPNSGYAQQFKSLASSSNLQQHTSENCLKTGKGSVAKHLKPTKTRLWTLKSRNSPLKLAIYQTNLHPTIQLVGWNENLEGVGMSKLPTLSHLRTPFQLCNPSSGIFAGKAQNILGTQKAVRNYNVSSIHPSPGNAGHVTTKLVRPDQTFIYRTQPTSSQKSSSKMQTRLPGLPIRKHKDVPLNIVKGPK